VGDGVRLEDATQELLVAERVHGPVEDLFAANVRHYASLLSRRT
jgi:hypothetical protein